MRGLAPAMLALVVSNIAPVAAIRVDLTPGDLDRAISLAGRSESERDRFHRRYRVSVGDPTVDHFEVMTEYRRAVLLAEERLRLGDHMFSARDIAAALKPFRQRVTVLAHVRFHPLNRYRDVPLYTITLAGVPGAPEITPLDVRRLAGFPLVRPPVNMTGAQIEATFDAASLARALRRAVVWLDSRQVAAAAIDFLGMD